MKSILSIQHRFIAWFAIITVTSVGNVFASEARINDHTLPNGLKIVVQEDHRSPVVVSMIWYRTGSIDEFNGTTGVAHALEHMMFKGTKSVPMGEFSRLIAAAGGKDNAFTSHDYTAYHQQLHKSQLPLAFKLEADRMSNLDMSRDEFAKEIKVVMEERRWRTDDQPHSLVEEQLMAAAFSVHPYQRPVIGWMTDLEHMTVQDARAWYRRWYVPNNAVLVVVGDVNPREVFSLAQRYFGKVASRPLVVRKPQIEMPQTGIRRAVVKAPSDQAYIMMGYHVPILINVEHDWEPYALSILSGILDGNDAARLNRSLVREQQLATGVGTDYDSIARAPGLFVLDAVPAQGKTVEQIEQAIRGQIEKIKTEGVTAEELVRVKTQIVSSSIYQRDSMFYQALLIGQLEMSGLPNNSFDTQLEKLRQVTVDQVKEVAVKYLQDDNLTVATLDPQPLDGKKPTQQPPAHLLH